MDHDEESMMSTRVLMAAVAAATLAFGLEPGTALANKPLYSVSGEITTTPMGRKITVNGRTYRIQSGSPAEAQQAEVVQGESVQLTLDGPASSRAAKVVAIHEAPGR
jgi:hypothetical protein